MPTGRHGLSSWVTFTALVAVGIGVGLANGIGCHPRLSAWPCLLAPGGLHLLAFISGAGAVGLITGSSSIFGKQFREGPRAQPSFSSRTMPNPPGAVAPWHRGTVAPKIVDWAVAILGFILPACGGFVLAGSGSRTVTARNRCRRS